MRVIVMKVSLKADWAHSLKEKRMVVKSIIAKLQNKFNISVGEIENQDIHNLITIGIAGIALDAKVCDSTIENIINYIEEITDAEIINIEQGVFAKINYEKCVECMECVRKCPTKVIKGDISKNKKVTID